MKWLHQSLLGATIAFVLELYLGTNNINTSTGSVAADPYKSSSFIGHSLWMVPSGNAHAAYSTIIEETAQELNTFAFVPHITLVAAILTQVEDVLERTHQLAAQLAPYQFERESVSGRDAYFQCVYAQFQRTQTVVAANHLARRVFPECRSDPPYTPHLSLVYGDLTEEIKQEQVIPKLKAQLEQRSEATTILPVDSIQVWSTQGDVREWYLVETIPLTGGQGSGGEED